MRRVLVSIMPVSVALCTMIAVFAALTTTSCAPPSEQAGSTKTGDSAERAKIIATHGGEKFTVGDFLDLVDELNPRARKALQNEDKRVQFVESKLTQELIYNEGVRQGLHEDPKIRKQLEDLQRRLVIQQLMMEHQGSAASDEEIRKYYDDNPQNFSTDRVSASHILVKEEGLAKEIFAKVEADPSVFESLAAEHSIDQSNANRGGDLGYFGRGRMVEEFEEAAFALTEDGQLSGLVKTRFGYHIIKRNGREDGAIKEFDTVKAQIRVHLINEKRRATTESFVNRLKDEAGLKIEQGVLAGVELASKEDD